MNELWICVGCGWEIMDNDGECGINGIIEENGMTFAEEPCTQCGGRLRKEEKLLKIDLSNTDWKELRKQKQVLIKAIECLMGEDEENLNGLLNFLDYIQDEAAKQLGKEVVFPKNKDE